MEEAQLIVEALEKIRQLISMLGLTVTLVGLVIVVTMWARR